MPSAEPAADDASAVARLRQRIAQGQWLPGQAITEEAVAEALGLSRTPVRLALRTLEQEGLLVPRGKRGLAVRAFSEADVLCALEVRGALEGLAARRIAEQGLSDEAAQALLAAVESGRDLLAKGHLVLSDVTAWSHLNRQFHHVIVSQAGSSVISDALSRNNHLPFASADSIMLDSQALDAEFQKLRVAQLHHELVLDAIERREGARAENLMREHAQIGVRYARWFGLKPPATSSSHMPTQAPRPLSNNDAPGDTARAHGDSAKADGEPSSPTGPSDQTGPSGPNHPTPTSPAAVKL